MLSHIYSGAVLGIEARIIEVETDISRGLPSVVIVGLPDMAVKESKDRVESAIINSGFSFPAKKITINLAPAELKKEGPVFDLPVALGILQSSGQMRVSRFDNYVTVGELSLDGRVRPIKGSLSIALKIREYNKNKHNLKKSLILPYENAAEAAVVKGLKVYPVRNLKECADFLNKESEIKPYKVNIKKILQANSVYDVDFSEVKGQYHAKRALEVAAAGSHNILMIGPPGSGKTMLAKRIPSILPDMTFEEAIQVTKVYSIRGFLHSKKGMLAVRPFRSPHHTASDVSLIGGGRIPKPGEVSLSHNGVLFLDELPEFKRNVLEVLRQPLEDGEVNISRAVESINYPSRFMLVASMNPCPCGYYGSLNKNCQCTTYQIQRYRSKISGPLLDRIDMHIEVPQINYKELTSALETEESAKIKDRVNKARQFQTDRFKKTKIHSNSQMAQKHIKKYCSINEESKELLRLAINDLGLSARAYDKILKISRTIADLSLQENILTEHISEAIGYRTLDRNVLI